MQFPKFDGDNPQHWMTCAHNYFDLYSVHPSMWVKCSIMQFVGSAAHWLQSIERRLHGIDWPTFCRLIRERFCRDQHELLLRQLFHIKQTTSVQDYVDRFVELIEQLSAYTPNPDHLSHTTRFVDGLRDDIRATILVQRPLDLDTACTLALLQEEAVEPGHRRDFHKTDGFSFPKHSSTKGALPLPQPPTRGGAPAAMDDRRPAEDRRALPKPATMEERLQSLRSYRKIRSLCIRCGERWQPGHKCAQNIQLHALQEVWNLCQDVFDVHEEDIDTKPHAEEQTPQLFMILSAATTSGRPGARTMQLQGVIEGRNIFILVDSGSSHSFINSTVVNGLSGLRNLPSTVSVQVADGSAISYS